MNDRLRFTIFKCVKLSLPALSVNKLVLNGEVDQEYRDLRENLRKQIILAHVECADEQIVEKQGVDKQHTRGKRNVFDDGGQRIFIALEYYASVYGEVEACAYNACADIGKHIPEGGEEKPV